MLRKKRYYVLYPEYFDKRLSRREGRKVPRNKAVEECSLGKIAYACKHLNFEYTIEKDKKYSRNWWNSEGRILVSPNSAKNKTELIRRVANIARRLKRVEKKAKSTKTKQKGRITKKGS